MPEPEAKGKLNPRLNVVLFLLTLISVLVTGGLYSTTNRSACQYLASDSCLDKERMAFRCITAGDPWHT